MTHFTDLQIGSVADREAGSLGNLKGLKSGTVAINPGSVAVDSALEVAVTIPGVAVGDLVLFEIPASLEVGLDATVVGRVSAADTVQLRLSNHTAGAIDGISRTWRYFWYDLT